MKPVSQPFFRRAALGVSLAVGIAFGAAAADAAPPASPPAGQAAMADAFSRHVQGHLDRLADRLEIKASQEPAWQAFEGALRDVMMSRIRMMMSPPAANADAASIARMRADHAQEQARKLARLADATAKLQQVLTPNQRAVLDEVARRYAGHRFGHHFGPMMDHHGMHCAPGAMHGYGYGPPMDGGIPGGMGGMNPGADKEESAH